MRTAQTRHRHHATAVAARVLPGGSRIEALERRTLFATVVWDGDSSAFWTDADNWVGGVAPTGSDDVVFPTGPTTLLVNVDALVSANGITFNGIGYELNNNGITLGSAGITANAAGGNVINSDVDLGNSDHLEVVSGSSLVINGSIIGNVGLTKSGGGEFTVGFGSLVDPGGPVMIDEGSVWIEGWVHEVLGIASGASINGNGQIDAIDALAGARVEIGTGGPGTMGSNNPLLEPGSSIAFEVMGTTPGTQHDQLIVNSNADISGSTLQVYLNGYAPVLGNEYVLIDSASSGVTITGTFAGLPEGAEFTVDDCTFQISYLGGASGNDVSITPVTVATTTTIAPSASTAPFSQPITFTASVDAAGAVTPTGFVRFYDGAALLGTVPLSGGEAAIDLSTLGVGGHTITAMYLGDTGYNGSTTATGASVTVTNNNPTSVGTMDVDVDEDAPEQTVDLTEVFEDTEDADNLTYSIVGTTNTALFDFVTLDGNQLTFTFAADAFGMSDVTVSATDSNGGQADAVFNVNVGSAPDPGRFRFASATYSIAEGSTAQVTVQRVGGSDGTATVDYAVTGGSADRGDDFTLSDGTLTFGDGETSKVISIPGKTDDAEEGSQTLVLTLSEPGGGAGLDSVTATTLTITDVYNHAPVAGAFTVTHAPGATATVSPLAHASDADGDAMTMSVLVPPTRGMATLDDAGTPADPSDDRLLYTPFAGTYGDDSFVYQVTDALGKSATATVTVRSQGVGLTPNVTDSALQDLVVVGTDQNDDIRIYAGKKKGDVKVTIDGESMGNYRPTGRVIAFGGDGDDTIELKYLKLGAVFYGGAGNDDLEGSRGSDILVGGDGDDKLQGWEKRDLLIGGAGADEATEKKTDDILLGDGTAYDDDTPANRLALFELLATWNGKGSAAARINKLNDGIGQLSYSLGDDNVAPDGAADVLAAATKKNWVLDLDAAA